VNGQRDVRIEKRDLRKIIKKRLHDLPQDRRDQEEEASLETLRRTSLWNTSEDFLIFLSMTDEFGTGRTIAQAEREGKRLWCPRMYGRVMKFHRLSRVKETRESPSTGSASTEFDPQSYRLRYNPYGIWEPHRDLPLYDPQESGQTLVLTPGLAFDRRGNRLGHGRAYYDSWFAEHRSFMKNGLVVPLALAYSVQLVDRVPYGEHDVALPYLLIGGELIDCR